jgi:DNA-binding NarL/FixJ family response regulator
MSREVAGWFLLPPEKVPERWRGRILDVALVALLPEEARTVLNGKVPHPEISLEDEPLARLVAQGLTVAAISHRLGVSDRSAHRRIARLRDRLGARSTAELAVELARHGF